MFIEFAFCHFFRGLHDEGGAVGVEQPEIMVGLGRAPFDQTQRANERPAETITADGKIYNRALSRCAMKCVLGHGHFAHRIFFDARFDALHRA